MSEAMDDDVLVEVCMKPFVQHIGRRVGIAGVLSAYSEKDTWALGVVYAPP